MTIYFYDRLGNPVAYSDDDRHIFLYGGEAVAYLESSAVYSYRGTLIGWFEQGWLRDKDGRCVAFTDQALGGPPRPAKLSKPTQAVKQYTPTEESRDSRSLRPIHSNAWSALSAAAFFTRRQQRWPGGMGKPDT